MRLAKRLSAAMLTVPWQGGGIRQLLEIPPGPTALRPKERSAVRDLGRVTQPGTPEFPEKHTAHPCIMRKGVRKRGTFQAKQQNADAGEARAALHTQLRFALCVFLWPGPRTRGGAAAPEPRGGCGRTAGRPRAHRSGGTGARALGRPTAGLRPERGAAAPPRGGHLWPTPPAAARAARPHLTP